MRPSDLPPLLTVVFLGGFGRPSGDLVLLASEVDRMLELLFGHIRWRQPSQDGRTRPVRILSAQNNGRTQKVHHGGQP